MSYSLKHKRDTREKILESARRPLLFLRCSLKLL